MLLDASPPAALLLVAAAVGAGAINTLVGSGTLLTFPTLLALGLPPVSANVTNNVGLVFGGVAGTWGYRRELAGQGRRLAALLPASLAGGTAGAILLLVLPEEVFGAVVPALVGLGVALVVAQPWLSRRLARRAAVRSLPPATRDTPPPGSPAPAGAAGVGLVVAVAAAGVYGGYFGAAQGVILIGLLGVALADSLQRLNAVKNALAATVNLVAALVFVVAAPGRVDWAAAAVVAVGATAGGLLGARYGRRLPAPVLRGVIVAVGLVAVVALVLR